MQLSSRRHLPDQELSRERPFGSAPFHICPGRVRPGASGGDVDLNGHSQNVRGETGPSAVQRYRLPWIAHHRDTHEADYAGDYEADDLAALTVDAITYPELDLAALKRPANAFDAYIARRMEQKAQRAAASEAS